MARLSRCAHRVQAAGSRSCVGIISALRLSTHLTCSQVQPRTECGIFLCNCSEECVDNLEGRKRTAPEACTKLSRRCPAKFCTHPSASSLRIACTLTKSPLRAGAFCSAASTESDGFGVSSRSGIT